MSESAVIEYQEKIVMIAAIKSINTFASKGGGLSLDITTKDISVFSNLVAAKTNACKIIISSVLINVSSGIEYKILKEVDMHGTIKSPVLKQENRTVEFKIESTNDTVAEELSMYNTSNGELFFYKIQIAVSSTKIDSRSAEEEPQFNFSSDEEAENIPEEFESDDDDDNDDDDEGEDEGDDDDEEESESDNYEEFELEETEYNEEPEYDVNGNIYDPEEEVIEEDE